MRTEQDLFTALAQREELAPEPDPVLAGARATATSYRRRRVAAAVGAIAAVAVLAVAAVVTVPGMLRDGVSGPPVDVPEVPEPRPPLEFTIQPTTVDGFEIHPYGVAADYQVARILEVGADEPLAELVVYEPNVEGSVGFDTGEVLSRWEYVPNGFAEIHGEPGPPIDEATLQELADGLRFTAPYAARLPYRLDYVPAGVVPQTVGQDTARPGAFGSLIALADTSNPTAPPILNIMVGDVFIFDEGARDPQPTTIAGRPAQCGDSLEGHQCSVEFEEFTVEIEIVNIDETELPRIVAGIQPATWDDPTTWYELDDALPGE